MTYFEKSRVDGVCRAFICWNGWGPPASEYQILEFCKSRSSSEAETEEITEILMMWMRGEFDFDIPLILKDDGI